MSKFNKVQMAQFDRYVQVQKSGKYNMLDPMAGAAAGLDKEEHLFIIRNYGAMARQKEGIKKR
jgi:hypothetical protein